MADNYPSARRRSEVLFDILKAKDSTEENKDSEAEQSSFISSTETNDNSSKKPKVDKGHENSASILKEAQNEGKIVMNSDKLADINIKACADASKYKGLLQEIDNQSSIVDLCAGLQKGNNLAIRCQSALSLAVFCRSQLNEEDCKAVFDTLNITLGHHRYYALSFCQALLLYILTKQNLSSEQITILEKYILKLAHSVFHQQGILRSDFMEARIILLGGERYLIASKLCEEMFSDQNLDINSLDVSTLCCSSLRSLSKLKFILTGRNKFSDATLKYVISMIGNSTQEIVSENLIGTEDYDEIISVSSYTVNQCLQVLELILSADPSSPCKTLDHEDFSLLRCLTKLLEWSITALFPQRIYGNVLFKVQTALQSFHLSTLVSILKVFSILSFDPDQYDYFTNVAGSMEKIMICILKIYFQTENNHFDVLVLALELMINFSFKCKKTFALVCLKKFQISGSKEVLAIEALLRILDSSLEKINKVKSRPTTKTKNGTHSNSPQECDDTSSEEHDMDLVLQAADEDMELSTIVSFLGILVMLFIDTKKSFLEFVRDKLSLERCTDTVTVSRKFLQFALMTGGMPSTGILLLRAAISKLDQLHPSS